MYSMPQQHVLCRYTVPCFTPVQLLSLVKRLLTHRLTRYLYRCPVLTYYSTFFHYCLTQFQLLGKDSVLHSSFLCWSAPRNTLIITPWMLPWATWSFPWSMMSLGIKSICAWCFGIIPYYLYLWPVFDPICAFFFPLTSLITVISFAISLAIVLLK